MTEDEKPLHSEGRMIRLLGWGDETTTPRAEQGFVPRLESLEHRVVLSEGRKVKIDFAVTDAAQVSTVPAPVVGLVAPPSGAGGSAGSVTAPGGEAGFDRVWVGTVEYDAAAHGTKTGGIML
jgi:hypothetical protein